MLETPKKKKRIWMAISENLKDYNIDMTPDQVRWKINALTKKYKKCIETECLNKFKYFKEMDNIYSLYNVDSDAYLISELMHDIRIKNGKTLSNNKRQFPESKHSIKIRKIRLANRIESDRCQAKINLERQWIEYLHIQECLRIQRDETIDRGLDIKEQELQLRKKELDLKQSIELRNIQLNEKYLDEYLQVQKEKCELLKQFFMNTF
ncbi:unnamed protein product [Diatraea saccharalis]|uniref:Myb/SANT-like DNA-binding domain-containing protein n=1 Tax=Diatraea saccharalis TaxID=40085 RepID=A0A9P0C391_9NEOP|nr:unnamed protein product [Diatraea saccharalis]